MPTAVANRYARALADVVAATGNYRQVLEELGDFGAAYRESVELREICETPAVALTQKLGVLEAIARRLGSSHVTLNFLRVLLSHYRLPLLEEVTQSFRNVSYARLGIVQVKISSAADLTNEQRELLRRRFDELTRQQSELEFHVDRDLIGGVVAQIGSTVYDGTILGRLGRLREQLLAQ
ncbi:MAG: ATP synthase F1 subunit delta [Acidobacteriia bacterium]|nr:ATP synthase F1 subunit delta [Terriglobia bacterium]